MRHVRISAGLLFFRCRAGTFEVLLVHPGGPYWQHKDEGAWNIPKGELHPGEEPFKAAIREFTEETGHTPMGPFYPLTPVRQKSGKIVHAWAVMGDWDSTQLISNTCTIEWPPKSGHTLEILEVDRAEWFQLSDARKKLNPAQVSFLEELSNMKL
ncbi:MAG: NUDIX domain-containing protein [Bdellovibrio sp.]|nr:NUDIX domain-containing protein [Bdellovibrio sp.]